MWRHEAYDFTTWLRDNIDVLTEAVALNLTGAESERPAGTFSVDIVAEDDAGRTVVIENQLGRSDHDHLGKVITYLTSFDAAAAVWLVGDARPEHVQAIAWLNETSAADFYLVKVEAIQIADSPPAPLLTLIVGPSEEAKAIGRQKEEIAERYDLRQQFWAGLLDQARAVTPMFAHISPSRDSWVSTTSIPYPSMNLSYSIQMHDSGGFTYIDGGPGSEDRNRRVFEALSAEQTAIEHAHGGPLE